MSRETASEFVGDSWEVGAGIKRNCMYVYWYILKVCVDSASSMFQIDSVILEWGAVGTDGHRVNRERIGIAQTS